jgi:hypothetical protein
MCKHLYQYFLELQNIYCGTSSTNLCQQACGTVSMWGVLSQYMEHPTAWLYTSYVSLPVKQASGFSWPTQYPDYTEVPWPSGMATCGHTVYLNFCLHVAWFVVSVAFLPLCTWQLLCFPVTLGVPVLMPCMSHHYHPWTLPHSLLCHMAHQDLKCHGTVLMHDTKNC